MSSHGAPSPPENLNGAGLRFGVVASRFHQEIVDRLVEGAHDCFQQHGVAVSDITTIRVPGAWELPLAAKVLADRGDLAGVIVLGVVIRGETPHFDFICRACSDQCAALATTWGRPVGFGLLTCNDATQANSRAGGPDGNKGWESAIACLEMCRALDEIAGGGAPST